MTEINSPATRAGFVALVGAPNAGKSTLLNQMVGEKLSIVSPRANTTRMRVLGILSCENTQMGLIDTPGVFSGKTGSSRKLDEAMRRTALESLGDADAILALIDAADPKALNRADPLLAALHEKKKKAFLALNKTDSLKPETLLPLAQELDKTGLFEEIFMISARTGDGVEALRTRLAQAMPLGPHLFPEDQLSDLPQRLFAAEVTREQLFLQLHDEIPYTTAVLPEKWEEREDGSALIHQTILVTRANHRAIVLGKNGARIKAIGQAAREEMKKALGFPVHLFLHVKLDEKWQEKNGFYQMFGLDG